jgi:CBS domain-containing protein
LLRELSYVSSRAAGELVVDWIVRPADAIEAELPLSAGQEQLRRANAIVLPVMQGDFPLGAVTRRGLLRMCVRQWAQHQGEDSPADRTLGHLLQASPILAPGRSLGEAAAEMVQYNIDALVVANQAAHLLGIITDDFILRALLDA